MNEITQLRAGDQDRDDVAETLRRHHAEGRIDTDELQERLGSALVAKTYAELGALVADLPSEAPRGRRLPAAPRLALLPLVLVAAVLGAVTHLFFLPVAVFLFVVRPLLWRRHWAVARW
jgi:hypothetical protein